MGYQRLIKEIKRDVGGPPGPDSVGTSQIINGTITTADICDNAITYEKIAANAVTNTRIANLAVTHAKLSSNCVESHNIVDRTILGIDISLGQIGEAHFDASFTAQLSAFAGVLNSLYTGVFELICNTNINVDFYYEEGAEKIYLFQFEEVETNTTYLTYSLPKNFASLTFFLASDQAIQSYSLTYASPTNGIVSHSQVGAGKIQFNILRNSQHYLELDINIDI